MLQSIDTVDSPDASDCPFMTPLSSTSAATLPAYKSSSYLFATLSKLKSLCTFFRHATMNMNCVSSLLDGKIEQFVSDISHDLLMNLLPLTRVLPTSSAFGALSETIKSEVSCLMASHLTERSHLQQRSKKEGAYDPLFVLTESSEGPMGTNIIFVIFPLTKKINICDGDPTEGTTTLGG